MADEPQVYPPWMSLAQAPEIAEVFQSFWTWAHSPPPEHEVSRSVTPIVADLLLAAAWDRLSLGQASAVAGDLVEARRFSLAHSTRHWMQSVFHLLEVAMVRAAGGGDRTLDDAPVIAQALASCQRVAAHRGEPLDPRHSPPPDWTAMQRRWMLSKERRLRETALAFMSRDPRLSVETEVAPAQQPAQGLDPTATAARRVRR